MVSLKTLVKDEYIPLNKSFKFKIKRPYKVINPIN